MKDKVIGYIYETRDYSKFKRMKGNRSVSHANRIKKSCDKNGQLMSPILVNRLFEIIDGQNRFEAWEECDLPIWYIIAEDYSVNECVALNQDAQNWKTTDFIDSFADRGNSNYIALRDLESKYGRKIPKSVIRSISRSGVGSGIGGYSDNCFREGEFVFNTNQDKVEQVLNYIMAFEFPKNLWGQRTRLMAVITFCFFCDVVNNDKLLKQWNNHFDLVSGCVNTKAAAEAVELVYNYGCKKTGYVFIASMYQADAISRSCTSRPGGANNPWK